jgi:hypothetical protein
MSAPRLITITVDGRPVRLTALELRRAAVRLTEQGRPHLARTLRLLAGVAERRSELDLAPAPPELRRLP